MEFIAEPGIILDVLSYNTMYFNESMFRYRDELFYGDQEITIPSLHYFHRFRAGKYKFDPLVHWKPLFQYRSTNYDFYPMFRYFWNIFDFSSDRSFFSELRSQEFKRCFFEFYLAKYSAQIDINHILDGDLHTSLYALSLLVKEGVDPEIAARYLCQFDVVIDEIIPYLEACYEKLKDFHKNIVPGTLKKVTRLFAESEREIKRMHGIDASVNLLEQQYTVCLMEHTIILSKSPSADQTFFFSGANGTVALRQWVETLGVDLFTFGRELGNEVKYNIVQELRRGERTVSQLSRALFVSRSTVDRCVSSMHNANIISFTKRLGTEMYLKLNPKYFIAAKARLPLDINDILEDIAVGSSSV